MRDLYPTADVARTRRPIPFPIFYCFPAPHTVTITITYLPLCFIHCLVPSCRTAYSPTNLYPTPKHLPILACVHAHILSCAPGASRLLTAHTQQDPSLLCYSHGQVYSSRTLGASRLLIAHTARFSTLELLTQQYLYNSQHSRGIAFAHCHATRFLVRGIEES